MDDRDETLSWEEADIWRANMDLSMPEVMTLIAQEGMADVLPAGMSARVLDYVRISFEQGFNRGNELGYQVGYEAREAELMERFKQWNEEKNAEEQPVAKLPFWRRLLG